MAVSSAVCLNPLLYPLELLYAARLRPLSLTAYADTKEEAIEKLKAMACVFIDVVAKRASHND